MYINPKWRILTVGDGDLSFSVSLLQHHNPHQLTATIFDDYQTLSEKYGDEHFQQLQKHACPIFTGVDVTDPESWSALPRHSFDLVIFQFPLLPGFASVGEFQDKCANVSVNLLNRRLLRQFLQSSFAHFLDPKGAQLCFITSKDVKPYREWNIEYALTPGTDINYVGAMPFDIANFPGYRIRNVDRDKHVKETKGTTYIWSLKEHTELDDKLTQPKPLEGDHCTFCRAGPFTSAQHRKEHENSKKHQRMQFFDKQWNDYLKQANTNYSQE